MTNIKIIRLLTGEDIISTIEETESGEYLLSQPMFFEIEYRNQTSHISMSHFLPVQMIQKNEVVIYFKDVMFMIDPTDEFAEYYNNSVDKLKGLFELRDSLMENPSGEPNPKMIEFLLDSLDPKEYIKH